MRNLVVILLAFLVSGCLAGTDSPTYDDIEKEIGTPIAEDASEANGLTSYNLDLIATVTGTAGRTKLPTEGYVETAVRGNYAYLCRTGPEQGLVIFDISNIEKPTQVGYINLDAGFEADIEISADENYAFWETQRFPVSAQTPNLLEPGANLPHGIHVVDISNKASPKWVSFTPVLIDGPHSITYANIDGRDIVFSNAYSYAYIQGQIAPPGYQRLGIYELVDGAAGKELTLLAEYVDPDAEEPLVGGTGEYFPHDVSVSVHPVTGQTLAYIAYWDLGVIILDVTNPASPIRIGQANDFGPAGYADIHMARAFPEKIDGKVVLVTEPEIGSEPDTGYMTFFDITDPTVPSYVSSWKIPGNATSGGGGRGPHYFDAANGRVVMASYAAGFWVIDVHNKANLERPRTVGFALPQPTEAAVAIPGPLGALQGGSAFDAWWVNDRYVIGSETGAGLVVYKYTGPIPAAK